MCIMSLTIPALFYLFEINISKDVFNRIILTFTLIEVAIFTTYNIFTYFSPALTTRNYGNKIALKAEDFIRNDLHHDIYYVVGGSPKYNQMSLSVGALLKSKPYVFVRFDDFKIPSNKKILAVFPNCNNKENTEILHKNSFDIQSQECTHIKTIDKFKNKNINLSFYIVEK